MTFAQIAALNCFLFGLMALYLVVIEYKRGKYNEGDKIQRRRRVSLAGNLVRESQDTRKSLEIALARREESMGESVRDEQANGQIRMDVDG